MRVKKSSWFAPSSSLTSSCVAASLFRPMQLHGVRHRLGSRAVAMVLVALVSGGALNWGHPGGDDPDCNPVLVLHDHAAHRFSAAPSQTAPAPDHCYICHSLQLLHTSVVARVTGTVP